MRTDAEIVAETNELAAYLLAELIGTGYTVPEGHKFYEAEDPRSKKAWDHAVRIMEMTTATEVKDALEAVLTQKERQYRSPDGAAITGASEKHRAGPGREAHLQKRREDHAAKAAEAGRAVKPRNRAPTAEHKRAQRIAQSARKREKLSVSEESAKRKARRHAAKARKAEQRADYAKIIRDTEGREVSEYKAASPERRAAQKKASRDKLTTTEQSAARKARRDAAKQRKQEEAEANQLARMKNDEEMLSDAGRWPMNPIRLKTQPWIEPQRFGSTVAFRGQASCIVIVDGQPAVEEFDSIKEMVKIWSVD